MADPATLVSRAREVLAKATDRDAHGFPPPSPWYVSGERPMIWAADGDAIVSIGARDETPYIEPPVADAIVLAVNSLAALCDVVEAAVAARVAQAEYHRAKHAGFESEKEARAAWADADVALDAAIARLEVHE